MSTKQLFTIERLLGLPSKRDVVDLTKETKRENSDLHRYQIRYQSSSEDSIAESDKDSVTSEGKKLLFIAINKNTYEHCNK